MEIDFCLKFPHQKFLVTNNFNRNILNAFRINVICQKYCFKLTDLSKSLAPNFKYNVTFLKISILSTSLETNLHKYIKGSWSIFTKQIKSMLHKHSGDDFQVLYIMIFF